MSQVLWRVGLDIAKTEVLGSVPEEQRAMFDVAYAATFGQAKVRAQAIDFAQSAKFLGEAFDENRKWLMNPSYRQSWSERWKADCYKYNHGITVVRPGVEILPKHMRFYETVKAIVPDEADMAPLLKSLGAVGTKMEEQTDALVWLGLSPAAPTKPRHKPQPRQPLAIHRFVAV